MKKHSADRHLKLPDTASTAIPGDDARLHAPSAVRNVKAICDLVMHHAPQIGKALEIASGTGQHIVALAQAMPGLEWQPTDIDTLRRASIDLRVKEADLPNLALSVPLNATISGWARLHADQNLILLVNLLHLISEDEAKVLVSEAALALAPRGQLILYGPFLRDGKTTSKGDARFHVSLREQDPDIGYKNDWDVIDWLQQTCLELLQVVEMPANNLAFIAKRPG